MQFGALMQVLFWGAGAGAVGGAGGFGTLAQALTQVLLETRAQFCEIDGQR